MKIKLEITEIRELLDAEASAALPPCIDLTQDREYEGEDAEILIDALVDAYSGNGNLILALDDEARAAIGQAEQAWIL